MYELKRDELIKGRDRLQRLWRDTGRAPIIVPLGRDRDDVLHYLVVTVKADNTQSEHVASFGRSSGGVEIAGCTCIRGETDKHCYHVSGADPVHRTFLLIENNETVYRMILGERSKRQ